MPETHRRFWTDKFEANIKRDRRNIKALLKDGWRVMVFWECALNRKKSDMDSIAKKVINWLDSNSQFTEYSGISKAK